MTTDLWFIQSIDHRISTALIFFLLLLLIGNKKKRKPMFPLRAFGALVAMCLVSWSIRTVVDVYLTGAVARGIGHSVHLLAMSLMHMASYYLCYKTTIPALVYIDLLALTIFKLAWNTFKVFAAAGKLIAPFAILLETKTQ